jgi:hypothetical protein
VADFVEKGFESPSDFHESIYRREGGDELMQKYKGLKGCCKRSWGREKRSMWLVQHFGSEKGELALLPFGVWTLTRRARSFPADGADAGLASDLVTSKGKYYQG